MSRDPEISALHQETKRIVGRVKGAVLDLRDHEAALREFIEEARSGGEGSPAGTPWGSGYGS